MQRACILNKNQNSFRTMERKKKVVISKVMMTIMLLVMSTLVPTTSASSSETSGCKDCLLDRLNCDCPYCKPVLGCLASCLWSGVPQAKCMTKCELQKGRPCLADCRRCMQACKCRCMQQGKEQHGYYNTYIIVQYVPLIYHLYMWCKALVQAVQLVK